MVTTIDELLIERQHNKFERGSMDCICFLEDKEKISFSVVVIEEYQRLILIVSLLGIISLPSYVSLCQSQPSPILQTTTNKITCQARALSMSTKTCVEKGLNHERQVFKRLPTSERQEASLQMNLIMGRMIYFWCYTELPLNCCGYLCSEFEEDVPTGCCNEETLWRFCLMTKKKLFNRDQRRGGRSVNCLQTIRSADPKRSRNHKLWID